MSRAIDVPPTKISGFLLNLESRKGASRAKFFARFGFTSTEPSVLECAIREHPDRATFLDRDAYHYNPGYKTVRFRCAIATPDGRNPCIITVWGEEAASGNLAFITAFPGPIPAIPDRSP